MFAAPPIVKTRVFATIPDSIWKKGERDILEGPSFDRQGNLYVVNTAGGQVLRITPEGKVTSIAEYDGEPNGLKIHKDGRIFIADHKLGLVGLDPATGAVHVIVDRPRNQRFMGLNDLMFDAAGDLYFTDQGESDLRNPCGAVWVLRNTGKLDCMIDYAPSPNGLVLTADGKFLFLAVTRANAIWRVPLREDGTPGRVGTYIQMSGGGGPDGMALNAAGGIAVAHVGLGSVWLFNEVGRPVAEIQSCAGRHTTNVAYGGPGGKTLFITEATSRSVLMAELDVPGQVMYSHA